MPTQAFAGVRPPIIIQSVEIPGAAALSTTEFASVANGASVNVSCLGVTQVKFEESTPDTYVADGSTNTSTTDIIPKMTSSTTPQGEVILSGNAPAVGDYGLFDDTNTTTATTQWAVISTSGWGGYDFGAGNSQCINKFSIAARDGYASHSPKDFTFEASNDGVTWTVLGTWTAEPSWANKELRWFSVTNSTLYRMYRINISVSWDATYCGIGEAQYIVADVATYINSWVQKQANTHYAIAIPDTAGTKTVTITNNSGSTQKIQIEYAS